MRILIIRHGDPYYPTDSLTEKGRREAEYLSERLLAENVTHAYVSPLGRAKLTAAPFLEKAGMQATELEWLREFPAELREEYRYTLRDGAIPDNRCAWDMPPKMWTEIPGICEPDGWRGAPLYEDGTVQARYDFVCRGWDELLAQHGYVRNGGVYRCTGDWKENRQTVALFCHLGLGTALLAHILRMSLTAAWHILFMPTSSVTTVLMEHHLDEPTAIARLLGVGDISHLYANGEPMSGSALVGRDTK